MEEGRRETFAISIEDVERAAERIAGEAVRTPLLPAPALGEISGARVFVKPECLQRTGSFKFRGAYNRLAAMGPQERARGVVATSSGNHAQGVAEAARLFGVAATIVMPRDAPAIKVERTQKAGARIVPFDRDHDDRFAIAHRLVEETGATFVSPYDDPFVMAGQGTVGLEIAADLRAQGLVADRVIVPTSGGGLLAGIATALAAVSPQTRAMPAEPEGFDDTTRSLREGRRLKNAAMSGSIADALLSPTPGELTFPINLAHTLPGYRVSDKALTEAMAFAARELKLVVEPGGATALAALLGRPDELVGRTVVAVISGGNADPAFYAHCLRT